MPKISELPAASSLTGNETVPLVQSGTTSRDLLSTIASWLFQTYTIAIQSGTGAALRTLINKFRETPSVKDYGAVGDGTTDDTTAIQNAINANLTVHFGTASDSYKVTSAITLRTGQVLDFRGATVTQATANTELFNIEGKSNIHAYGGYLVGKGDDYIDSDSSRAVAFYGGTSGSNNNIYRNKFTNFTYTPVRYKAQSFCSFNHNLVIGPGSPTLSAGTGRCYGILFDAGCTDGLIYGNNISQTAQGVRLEQNTNITVFGNNIKDIVGQHGMYIGSGMTNIAVTGNTINNVYNIGIKVQAADSAAMNNSQVTIVGNTITTCGDQGISFQNSTPGNTYKVANSIISGNTIKTTTGNGINISDCLDIVIAGNTIQAATQNAIYLAGYSQEIVIDKNILKSSALSAIASSANASTFVSIHKNKIINCATASTVGNRYGIYILSGSDYDIEGNIISDANAKMQYGIYLAGTGSENTFSLERNAVKDATDYGLRVAATTALKLYRDNYWNGTLGTCFSEPTIPTVASAATIAIPQGYRVVFVSGTTNITSVTATGHSNETVTLIFLGALTFTDGSNLLLAGNFVTTANDTITLTTDGINWYEVARSVN